jgi:hypothetical protein
MNPASAGTSQAIAAAHLGLSEGAVKVAITAGAVVPQSFAAEIAQTLHDPADLDDEMRHLVAALAG